MAESATATAAPEAPARSYIVVPMPSNMREMIVAEAKAADKPVGPYLRDWIAAQRGIELPATVTTRRSKYTSEEERKAAQKERNKSRSELIKQLLQQHRQQLQGGNGTAEANAAE